jgi:hypothetical protein
MPLLEGRLVLHATRVIATLQPWCVNAAYCKQQVLGEEMRSALHVWAALLNAGVGLPSFQVELTMETMSLLSSSVPFI